MFFWAARASRASRSPQNNVFFVVLEGKNAPRALGALGARALCEFVELGYEGILVLWNSV